MCTVFTKLGHSKDVNTLFSNIYIYWFDCFSLFLFWIFFTWELFHWIISHRNYLLTRYQLMPLLSYHCVELHFSLSYFHLPPPHSSMSPAPVPPPPLPPLVTHHWCSLVRYCVLMSRCLNPDRSTYDTAPPLPVSHSSTPPPCALIIIIIIIIIIV